MANEILTSTLQESVLSLLAHDDMHGKIVSRVIEPAHFTGDYRLIAERCLGYWERFGEAPKMHIDDELSDILDDPKNRKAQTYRRIIKAMSALAGGMNAKYVVSKVDTFVRMQQIRQAIVDSAEQLNKPRGEDMVSEVERVWNDLMRKRKEGFSPGVRLSEYDRLLVHLDTLDEFTTGIGQLDNRYVVPARGTTMLFLGAAGRGKTWFLINCGRRALAQRKRVVHVTCEMSEEQNMGRYYQSIFAVPKRRLVDSQGDPVDIEQSILRLEGDKQRFVGFDSMGITPDFSLDAPMVREELAARVDHYAGRYDNLIIKRFPPRSVDERVLRGYLDTLEAVEGFIPDLLIFDYMGLWKTGKGKDEHRIGLGIGFQDFRGICVERNMAGVTAHQLSRVGAEAVVAKGIHVAEDWSMIGTSDIVLTYSCTDWEHEYGLGRLQASKVRDEQDRFNILMTQNYALGQFCVESMYQPSDYHDIRKEAEKASGIVDDEGDDDEEDI